ncbi:hypothetical protein OH687_02035 [Burkholderia anthina]|nr:hypothetical protein OH687_02035 [Burkholderia anthina]
MRSIEGRARARAWIRCTAVLVVGRSRRGGARSGFVRSNTG